MTVTPITIKSVQIPALITLLSCVATCALIYYFYFNFSWQIALTDSAVSNLLLVLACIAISNLLGFYQPKNGRAIFILVITGSLTYIIVFLAQTVLATIFTKETYYLLFLNVSLPIRVVIAFLCLAWCAIANILWYKLDEQSANQQRLLTAQSLAKEAELNKLRHQLQPHFLFNSLNSVFALTMINPQEAGVMITKLASFLRGTLKRDDEVWVNVAEEMEYIQLYLDIEKVRFSHRLNIAINIAENTLKLTLPGTLLQPIVENAIKFGLYNTAKAITITINVSLAGQMLIVAVKNPFDPEMKATGGTGFGLSAIRRRLYLLFADSNLLQTEITTDNLYITVLKIPQKNDKNDIN